MHLKSIKVVGLQGFAEPERITFAIPNGKPGSGLTMIVGPNNAGKSSILDCIGYLSKASDRPPSFPEGRRNKKAGDRICIIAKNDKNQKRTLVTNGGSEALCTEELSGLPTFQPSEQNVLVIPSRRTFQPYFGKNRTSRRDYIRNMPGDTIRNRSMENFTARLFQLFGNGTGGEYKGFQQFVRTVAPDFPDWVIDQSDQGTYYLKMSVGEASHTSGGLGEGLISLLFIMDALRDAEPGSLVAIDEPELSLHPQLQRRLAIKIVEHAKEKQVIISTHSPYFVNWDTLQNGGKIVRIFKKEHRSRCATLTEETAGRIAGLLKDRNNPHVLGLDASEMFFIPDGAVLVEGQEDVIHYRRICTDLGIELGEQFFGWGTGGASKMGVIAGILNDLGFEQVFGILDGNKRDEVAALTKQFPKYKFRAISADDVRSKPVIPLKAQVRGLLDENGKLREEFRAEVESLLREIREDLRPSP